MSPFGKTNQSMLFKEIIALYHENNTKGINTVNGVKYLITNMIIVLYAALPLAFLCKYVSDTRRVFPSQFGPVAKADTPLLLTVCRTLRSKKFKTRGNIQNNGDILHSKSCCDPHFASPFLGLILPYCAVGIPQLQITSL